MNIRFCSSLGMFGALILLSNPASLRAGDAEFESALLQLKTFVQNHGTVNRDVGKDRTGRKIDISGYISLLGKAIAFAETPSAVVQVLEMAVGERDLRGTVKSWGADISFEGGLLEFQYDYQAGMNNYDERDAYFRERANIAEKEWHRFLNMNPNATELASYLRAVGGGQTLQAGSSYVEALLHSNPSYGDMRKLIRGRVFTQEEYVKFKRRANTEGISSWKIPRRPFFNSASSCKKTAIAVSVIAALGGAAIASAAALDCCDSRRDCWGMAECDLSGLGAGVCGVRGYKGHCHSTLFEFGEFDM